VDCITPVGSRFRYIQLMRTCAVFLLVVLLGQSVVLAQTPSTSTAVSQSINPRVSAAMKHHFEAASELSRAGHLEKAIALLEDVRSSPQASDSDRLVADKAIHSLTWEEAAPVMATKIDTFIPKPAVDLVQLQLAATPTDSSVVPHKADDEYLAEVAHRLQRRLKDFTVTPDPGQASLLVVDSRGVKVGHLAIQPNHERCVAENCQGSLSGWLDAAVDVVNQRMLPPAPIDVRVIVARREVIESELEPRGEGAPPVPMHECLGELVCVLGVEEQSSLRYLDMRDLDNMSLTEDQAYGLAMSNTRRELRPMSKLKVPTVGHPIEFNDLDSFESARMLLTADWARMAAQMRGELIAMVPATNLVVYGRGGSPEALRHLRQFAADALPSGARPLEAKVFRWSGKKWVPLP